MVVISQRPSNEITSLHESVIGALPRPYWLKNESLLDNQWTIQIGDEETHHEKTIDFDTPITAWPKGASLADPQFEHDLITIKLVIFLSLKPKPVGWLTKSSSIQQVFGTFCDFVRWRTDRGVKTNSDLTAAWYNEFDTSYKNNGREGLLRLTEKAAPVLQAIKVGQLTPVLDDRHGISGNAVARLTGVGAAVALTTSSRFAIKSFFAENGIKFTRVAPLHEHDKIGPTATTATQFYKVLFELWRYRDHLTHDQIGYRAFKSRREISRHTFKHFRTPNPTEDAPAYQTNYLINAALKVLFDPASEKLIDIVGKGGIDDRKLVRDESDFADCNRRLKALGLPEIAPRYHRDRWSKGTQLSIQQFVFWVLPMAARVVIAAFSARRDDEIESTKIDCIEIDKAGEAWLNCMIVKNVDHRDLVPVPKSVVRAVQIVQKVRALGNKVSKKLYDFACPILKRPVYFLTRKLLPIVADYLQVPAMDDGNAWHFKPHQFRKFFATTYFWRWAFPNLTALTYHLRHFNPDTTRAYIEMKAAEALRMRDEKLAEATRKSNIERRNDFDASKSSFVLWTLREAARGSELRGALGRRIDAQIEALKAEFLSEIQITEMEVEEDSFDALLSELAKTINLEPHPEGHSLCGWGTGPDGIKQHQCMSRCLLLKMQLTGQTSASAAGPDFSFAEDTGCLVCPLRVALPTMAPRWEEEIRSAELALVDADDELAPYILERIKLIQEYA